jgi:CubicO group peptidase (beta-lactamase class C family)
MQLVAEGKLNLDRPIGAYLPRPLPEFEHYRDLAGDPRWQRITMRMLLGHSAGFANLRWLEPDGKLSIHFDPGTRYAYSGEGLFLAQFVIELGLGLDVGAELERRIFEPLGMRHTSLLWQPQYQGNIAQGYALDGARIEHDRRDEVHVAGSMDTSLADWAHFLAALVSGDILGDEAFAEMTRRTIAIRSAAQFPTLSAPESDAWDSIALGYGAGWGLFDSPMGPAFFKEGHDDGTANYALCMKESRDCILLMSNSVRAEGIFKELVERLFGETNLPWRWEGYRPYTLPE